MDRQIKKVRSDIKLSYKKKDQPYHNGIWLNKNYKNFSRNCYICKMLWAKKLVVGLIFVIFNLAVFLKSFFSLAAILFRMVDITPPYPVTAWNVTRTILSFPKININLFRRLWDLTGQTSLHFIMASYIDNLYNLTRLLFTNVKATWYCA